jgi:hypothetical protein
VSRDFSENELTIGYFLVVAQVRILHLVLLFGDIVIFKKVYAADMYWQYCFSEIILVKIELIWVYPIN